MATKIPERIRREMVELVWRNGDVCAHEEHRPWCGNCLAMKAMLDVLDADQREHGPPIDVTDPSFVRSQGG